MLMISVGCIPLLFGIFCLIFLNHSSLCFGEAKSKSTQKSIEIQLKLIYRSPHIKVIVLSISYQLRLPRMRNRCRNRLMKSR